VSTVARNTAGGSRSSGAASGFIDPATLMRIKSLQMRAQAVVDGFMSGIHRSPYFGFSVEFSEYRQYSPGDDPRYLDWRLYARSDRYYLKRFEDETNLRCYLLVDTSRSMGYSSIAYTKSDYARTAAATIAYFLSTQRDAVGLLTFEDEVVGYLPPRYRPGHLRHVMAALQREPEGRATDLVAPLKQIASTVRKRGLVVMISDLLAPVDVLATHLGYLRSQGHEVILLRVLDPAEMTFEFQTPAMFQDIESQRELYVDPLAAKAGYLERFNAHADALQKICENQGIELVTIRTDRALEMVLFDLLRLRMSRSRRAARRPSGRGGGRG